MKRWCAATSTGSDGVEPPNPGVTASSIMSSPFVKMKMERQRKWIRGRKVSTVRTWIAGSQWLSKVPCANARVYSALLANPLEKMSCTSNDKNFSFRLLAYLAEDTSWYQANRGYSCTHASKEPINIASRATAKAGSLGSSTYKSVVARPLIKPWPDDESVVKIMNNQWTRRQIWQKTNPEH